MTYNDAIDLIRQNAFNIRQVPIELIDERLLRFVRKCHAWAIDAWMTDLPKPNKAWAKEVTQNVWYDIGIIRKYEDIV